MKLHIKQKGFSFASLSFWLLLIGFAAFNALKLLPVYMESFEIESSVKSLESDRAQTHGGVSGLRASLFKRLKFNNVTEISRDDVLITKEDNTYTVEVDYERRLPYMANVDIVLSFTHSAKVPAN